ncbi:MAG: ribonuclease III [Deltaproteobacteria bacterium]|nr:MAG: ribonuclease III [Deltaproteobacteria bacterium]
MGASNRRTLRNQRLEFLGDSILSYVVSRYLFESYPDRDEGFLSKIRSKLVDNRFLARVGRRMGLEEILAQIRRRYRKRSSGRLSLKVMGDIVESIVGALYLDGGIETAERFIQSRILTDLSRVEDLEVDFKTSLQEWCQKKGLSLPEYKILYSRGPEHDKFYVVSVSVVGVGSASGEGRSKKEAEQEAARKMMESLGR